MLETTNERYQINCLIVGTVSAGKTTFLNALFANKYSNMKLKRTTMVPQVYHETNEDIHDTDDIEKNNNSINEKLIKKSEQGIEITYADITEIEYFVPKIYNIVSLKEDVYFTIYDTPGLNDAKTKNLYYEYINKNFYKFNLIIFVIDINSAMNTSDEVDILNMLLTNIKQNTLDGKSYELLILINKCDEMFIKNKQLVFDDDYQEMYDQAKTIIDDTIKKTNTKIIYKICPVSSEDAYIYRMYKKNPTVMLDLKYINKFGYNEYGKSKWNKFSEEEKINQIKQLLQRCDYNDRMTLCGFNHLSAILTSWLNEQKQYDILCGHIIYLMNQVTYAKPVEYTGKEIHSNFTKLFNIDKNLEILVTVNKKIMTINQKFLKIGINVLNEMNNKFNIFLEKYMTDIDTYLIAYAAKLNNNIDGLENLINDLEQYKIQYEKIGVAFPKQFHYSTITNHINSALNNFYINNTNENSVVATVLSYAEKLIANKFADARQFIIKIFKLNNNIYQITPQEFMVIFEQTKTKYNLTNQEVIDILGSYLINRYCYICTKYASESRPDQHNTPEYITKRNQQLFEMYQTKQFMNSFYQKVNPNGFYNKIVEHKQTNPKVYDLVTKIIYTLELCVSKSIQVSFNISSKSYVTDSFHNLTFDNSITANVLVVEHYFVKTCMAYIEQS